MNLKDEKEILMDKYIFREISTKEYTRLVELTKTDPELKKDFELEKGLLGLGAVEEKTDLRKRIEALNEESINSGRRARLIEQYREDTVPPKAPIWRFFKPIAAAASIALLLSIAYFTIPKQPKQPKLATISIPDKQGNMITIAIKKYIQHQEHYTITRSTINEEEFMLFKITAFKKYDNKNYQEAAKNLLKCLAIKEDYTLRFYLGHCQLQQYPEKPNLLESAILNFEKILQDEDKDFPLYTETEYNLYIAYLIDQQKEKARKLYYSLIKSSFAALVQQAFDEFQL